MTKTQNTLDQIDQHIIDAAGLAQEHLYGDMDATSGARLGGIAYVLDHVNAQIAREVRAARSMGTTWEQIGNHLGMTKQGAQQRFSA